MKGVERKINTRNINFDFNSKHIIDKKVEEEMLFYY